jgi:hypothetical protein
MILNDNLLILRNRFPAVLDKIKRYEMELQKQPIEIVQAKNGLPTLTIQNDEQTYYVHSKYDPKNEAEKFVEQFEGINPNQHIFFYGIGLGYHIRAFQDKVGTSSFTIYEPNPAIFYHFICTYNLKDYSFKNLKNIYLGSSDGDMTQQLMQFINQIKESVLLVAHPSYQVAMKDESARFDSHFKNLISHKRSALRTNLSYEKLWTVNSVNNLKHVLSTPSVLRDKKSYFEGKPVLLVAAGPSLIDELDNIRHIKSKGLAYIIAVGSANRSLIQHDIIPDAVTSYDPNTYNHQVFEEIINQGIDTIPLIFGSSVGYETLERYPGSKLHMITSQDSINPYLIGSEELLSKREVVSDAPSIAVLTLELLVKLNCSRIILVGQNLGYRNNQYYADGIRYSSRPTELRAQEINKSTMVESVDGEMIYSSHAFIQAKHQLEATLAAAPRHIEYINTTVGGAKITGTTFMSLSEVIESKLGDQVVVSTWHEKEEFGYDMDYIKSQAQFLMKEYEQFESISNEILGVLRRLDSYANNQDNVQINRLLPRFDKLFKKMMKNMYNRVLLQPLIRVQFEMFQKASPTVRLVVDPAERVGTLMQVFGKFIAECQNAHTTLGVPMYHVILNSLKIIAEPANQN